MQVDWQVTDTASFALFEPQTRAARIHGATMFKHAQIYAGAFVVDRQHAGDILFDLVENEGFLCSLGGRQIERMEVAR